MKVIIPVAGHAKRLRPHTHTKPKPLLMVAGKPIIDYIMERVVSLQPTEVIFITGRHGELLEHHIRTTYPALKCKFIEQKVMKGPAHAVWLANEAFDEDVLIWFGDTIFEADFSSLRRCKDDGIIWAKMVDDYRRWGVMVTDEQGYITKIVEKPSEPISFLANIGLYYIKDTALLREASIAVLEEKEREGKEAFSTQVFDRMIQHGAKIRTEMCTGWYDCGTSASILETNRTLLGMGEHTKAHPGAKIIPPVTIAPSADIQDSVIGPFVSISANAVVRNSKVENSILDVGAEVHDAELTESILGVEAFVRGRACKAIIGDHSRVEWIEERKETQ